MKRDLRLQGLSSEHHQALVLARRLLEGLQRGEGWSAERGSELAARVKSELEPHFAVEEDLLLPALRAIGEHSLCERLERDHAALRRDAAAARMGDDAATRRFAERLVEHVRFEERELFPACEARLPSAVLDEVGRRASR
jgi:hemerythrin-like domain-containing protein